MKHYRIRRKRRHPWFIWGLVAIGAGFGSQLIDRFLNHQPVTLTGDEVIVLVIAAGWIAFSLWLSDEYDVFLYPNRIESNEFQQKVIYREEIARVYETKSNFPWLIERGLAVVKAAPSSRLWGEDRIFVPASAVGYEELKKDIMSWAATGNPPARSP